MRNWFDDHLDLLLGKHYCYGHQKNTSRNASKILSWRFCIQDGYGVVEGSLSRETDLAEVRIHLAPTFTRFEPLTFLSLGLYERLDQQKKIPATIIQMKEQVKEIIVSIPAEILRRLIGELGRRIQTLL